ncbi:MAG: O-antigen ligase family protein [candidate division Zixibacteria bacterium]|nr:O-antigen ligase family protein [candidate division Zixibacteria bacterium]
MSSRISHIPFFEKAIISDWKLFVAGTLYVLPIAGLLLWQPKLAVLYAMAPFVILLLCHGPSLVYLLVISTFLFLPFETTITILPPDIVGFLLVIAYIIDKLHGRLPGKSNYLAMPFMAYLAVILVSIALEGFTTISIKFFLRQGLLFCTFYAVAHFGERVNKNYLFLTFIGAALLNSTYSLYQFLSAGGTVRAFGLAGKGYADHVMIGFVISIVFYLWSTDLRKRIFWAGSGLIMVGAMAATQTRASVITAGFGLLIVLFFAIKTGKKMSLNIPRRNLIIASVLTCVSIVLLALYTPVFDGIVHRFGRMGLQASGTILLRISLWTAGIKAFLANPFLGIGAGNFAEVFRWVPEVRFDPIFYMVEGLSTHSILVTVLAETGLAGLIAVSLFYKRAISKSYNNFRISESDDDTAATLCLFAIASCIVISSIYAGAWFWGNNSFHMAVFFGIIVSYRHRQSPLVAGGASV